MVVAVLVVVGLAGISALGVRRHLLEGRDALTRGQGRAGRRRRGDGARASSRARIEAFVAAADGSRSIWLSLVDAVPFVGNTPDAIRAVADAGVQTADAAEGLAAAVADLPGGLGALAPTAERHPDRPSVRPHRGHRTGRRADRSARWTRSRSAPTGFVLGPVTSGTVRRAGRAREAAPPAARRLVDPRPAAVVPGRRRSPPVRVRRLEPGRAARHRRADRRVRDPHRRRRPVELLRLPPDPVAPSSPT